ncbi:hypothetical protein G6K88_31300 [Agrobacterium rhizogenes]|uniref:Uncharacterized protein n=1 Tax=Rhizobium rhizogenes TaxID=359 RepID=A0A7S4ZSI0_RHIRH|nr:hypothetical protein [Rhizobium rhizogenes]NTG30115.1 hypothetical protein [Rhizobium rhizogenes]NTI06526.1 hypothetical protein [Rhizobium rhizogenes]NTI13331.1 hypothetical protein [Rhizobium rhizogenes]QCL09347.1 hypothetical protein pC5.7c_480 [Rhizobium rhizogenes]QCL09769.1 hypothetical protein pC5.8b_279 [Rhizobium rhizogenes]
MKMSRDQIPEFVDAVLATGCDICAFAQNGYVIGDSDLPPEIPDSVREELHRIGQQFGERDHLLRDIADYLRSISRVFVLNRAVHSSRMVQR